MIDLINPQDIFSVWPEAVKQLRKTAKYDPEFDENEILTGIINNKYQLWQTKAGFVLTGIRKRRGETRRIFRIFYAAGSILGATEAPFSYVRQIMRKFEEVARTGRFNGATAPKCSTIKFSSRKGWGRILKEYKSRELSDGSFVHIRRLD